MKGIVHGRRSFRASKFSVDEGLCRWSFEFAFFVPVQISLSLFPQVDEDGASKHQVSGLLKDDEASELQGSRLLELDRDLWFMVVHYRWRIGVRRGSIHGGSLSMEDWVGGDADDADKVVTAVPVADVNPSEAVGGSDKNVKDVEKPKGDESRLKGDNFFDGLSQLEIDDDQVVLAGLEAVGKIHVPAPNPNVVGQKSDALHTDEETEDTVSDTPLLDKRKRAPALKSPFVDFGSADVGSTPMELMSSGSQSAGDDRDFKMVTYVKGLYALNDAFADPVSTEIEAKFDAWIGKLNIYKIPNSIQSFILQKHISMLSLSLSLCPNPKPHEWRLKLAPNLAARLDPSSLSSGHRRNTPPQSQLSSRSRSLFRSGQARPLTLSFSLRPSSHKITLYIQCTTIWFSKNQSLEHYSAPEIHKVCLFGPQSNASRGLKRGIAEEGNLTELEKVLYLLTNEKSILYLEHVRDYTNGLRTLAHTSAITTVDWHPTLPIFLSGSADNSIRMMECKLSQRF
ncbi:hypothetical protein G4B88_018205 [Cannabis sativa]|uniref:Uncharacterized protein n=1 Tax=Cannabis sativa TaxID=3483 RepID=A0A7J6GBK8_CANSA|nr:hypothetical protein G4B88_018205 [Cannabis sativa]